MEKHLKDLFSNKNYNKDNFFIIAGSFVAEGEEIVMEIAEKVSATCSIIYGNGSMLLSGFHKINCLCLLKPRVTFHFPGI